MAYGHAIMLNTVKYAAHSTALCCTEYCWYSLAPTAIKPSMNMNIPRHLVQFQVLISIKNHSSYSGRTVSLLKCHWTIIYVTCLFSPCGWQYLCLYCTGQCFTVIPPWHCKNLFLILNFNITALYSATRGPFVSATILVVPPISRSWQGGTNYGDYRWSGGTIISFDHWWWSGGLGGTVHSMTGRYARMVHAVAALLQVNRKVIWNSPKQLHSQASNTVQGPSSPT